MHSGLDLKLQTGSFTRTTTLTQTTTMFPVYATYEEEQKPFQFCMPTVNMGIQEIEQYQNPMLIPNLINNTTYSPTGEGLSGAGWENYNNGIQENGMRFKRQRGMEEAPFVMGNGSGSGQFLLNGVGNVVEPVRTARFGLESGGMGFYQHYYPYQSVSGFTVGTTIETISPSQISENLNDHEEAERRFRRIIRNRESAARSRARKQAYNAQQLLEIMKLKKENEFLRRVLRTLIAITRLKIESIRRGLLRTFSGPL